MDRLGDGFQLLTIKQAAARLCCSVANVYVLVASGELPVVRIGCQKGYRVDSRDLDSFVTNRKFRYRQTVQISPAKFKHLRS
jgi:excisionase family DNA binding protein